MSHGPARSARQRPRSNHLDTYMLLAGIRHMYQRDVSDSTAGRLGMVELRRRATEYVLALYTGLSSWASVEADTKRKLHDASNYTELFRRIPAFLELAELQVVTPLKIQGAEPPAATEVTEEAEGGEGEPAPPPGQPLHCWMAPVGPVWHEW